MGVIEDQDLSIVEPRVAVENTVIRRHRYEVSDPILRELRGVVAGLGTDEDGSGEAVSLRLVPHW